MNQDYRHLSPAEHELMEKQTLRMIVQALQEYSREAKQVFDNTKAPSKNEVIVLAEDLVQYALEVAETYPINRRYAGFIDYKRIRWLPTPYGLLPQALLVDAKASTENNRETLQQSQLPMDADFTCKNVHVQMSAGVEPHLDLSGTMNGQLVAVTTSIFVHFYYQDVIPAPATPPYRELKTIYALAIPHARFKQTYNPNATTSFFGQGKHSSARNEEPRIRVYFTRLQEMCPWRLQRLDYAAGPYTEPNWRDGPGPTGTVTQFAFLGR